MGKDSLIDATNLHMWSLKWKWIKWFESTQFLYPQPYRYPNPPEGWMWAKEHGVTL